MVDDQLRVPPNSLESEMAVLGSLLVDSTMLDAVTAIVTPSDFYAHVHETIYASILKLAEQHKPIDTISLATALKDRGQLDQVGGLPYLRSIQDTVPTAASADYYANIVHEKAILRGLIGAGTTITALGYNSEDDVDGALLRAQEVVRNASTLGSSISAQVSASDLMRETYAHVAARASGELANQSIDTPWKTVNNMVGRFEPGQIVVLASSPGIGKTAMSLRQAEHVAMNYGRVAFFSFEMTLREVGMRVLAMHSRVSVRNQREGRVSDSEWERIASAMSWAGGMPISWFGIKSNRLDNMRRELANIQKNEPIRAVFIDHAGFIADIDNSNGRESKHERLDKAYRRLLAIADEFQTTIFAVQHINRSTNDKDGAPAKPTMTQIRDGGNIEGHANTILLPYRPYATSDDPEKQSEAELIIGKCRDGTPGTIPMRFYGARHEWVEDPNSIRGG